MKSLLLSLRQMNNVDIIFNIFPSLALALCIIAFGVLVGISHFYLLSASIIAIGLVILYFVALLIECTNETLNTQGSI